MEQLDHHMGSLLPQSGKSMFAQIYFVDGDMDRRVELRESMTTGLNRLILCDLEDVMQRYNPLAQDFIAAGEVVRRKDSAARGAAMAARQRSSLLDGSTEPWKETFASRTRDLLLRLHVNTNDDPQTHNLPTISEVGRLCHD